MSIKDTKTYQFLRAVDIDTNEVIGGNRSETISAQTARGYRERTGESGINKSIDMAHGNMLLGGMGIVGGASLLKKSPLLGIAMIVAGAVVTGVTVDDWKKGKL